MYMAKCSLHGADDESEDGHFTQFAQNLQPYFHRKQKMSAEILPSMLRVKVRFD